jgi:hypothetical protein
MNLSLSLEPLLPWLAILAISLIALALAAAGLWRKARGAWFRFGAVCMFLLALANPVFLSEQRDPVKSVVAIIADRSQSQSLGNRTQQTDDALKLLQERIERFGRFEVRVVEASRAQDTPDRSSTRLFASLSEAMRDVPPGRVAGAIVLSDGQVHDVPATKEQLGFDAPVHALVTGQDNETDRVIQFTQAPKFGIANKALTFEYLAEDQGNAPQGGDVQVKVFLNGEQIAEETATLGEKMPLEVTLDRAGPNIIELTVDPVAGEVSSTNNQAVASVDGIRENLRVLLVSGEPHAGERTWRNLLKSDASVDLVHFTILRPPEKQDGTPINELSLIAFPTRELFVERINDFDLIIFDRYQHRDVLPTLYYDYIAQYVEQGGALLVAAGPEYAGEMTIANTPLVAALPATPTGEITEQGFLPQLTGAGKRHPVTRGLEGSSSEPPNWSRWFRIIDVEENPVGEVVMKGPDDRPLLILNRKGKGRIGMFLSDQGWLWARGFEGGGPYVSLYRRIAHWLMKEPELEEEALTAVGKDQSLEISRQTMANEVPAADIILPSGKKQTVNLAKAGEGKFTGKLDTSEIGLFRIASGDLTTLAHVGPINAPEFLSTVSTFDKLAPIAKQTGGVIRRLVKGSGAISVPDIVPVRGRMEAAASEWLGLKTTDETTLRSVSRLPLFAGFLGLAVLLLALGSMWYREGR